MIPGLRVGGRGLRFSAQGICRLVNQSEPALSKEQKGPDTLFVLLPHPALRRAHHRLAGFAVEGFAELRHVSDYAVYAKLSGRVLIGLSQHPR